MNIYGLIGYPLGHSFSKKYFTKKFQNEAIINSVFELFPISSIDQFPSLIFQNPALKGLAVTIPYKQTVIPFLHEIDGVAKETGAVNCISFINEVLKGYNTDIIGFEKSFVPLLQPHHTKALLLGTGGASKAVQYVLAKLKIGFLVVSRTPEHKQISYEGVTGSLLFEYNVIINCSPVGLTPLVNAAPAMPYNFISDRHYCYDLIYTPEETLFLQHAKKQGAQIKNGYEMLELQAEENWKIWNRL